MFQNPRPTPSGRKVCDPKEEKKRRREKNGKKEEKKLRCAKFRRS
jgi:hypothetical protein